MANKGTPFEREVCNALSEWWTGKTEDSVFWRTDQSGGRATTRRKKGLKTAGRCGDICSTDPCSAAFTKLITVECKRGYGTTVADLLDRPRKMRNKNNQTKFEEFIEQILEAQINAGTPYWMLIHRRDHKEAMVFIPESLYKGLINHDEEFQITGKFKPMVPVLFMTARVETETRVLKLRISGMKLDLFLSSFTPDHIRSLWKHHKKT